MSMTRQENKRIAQIFKGRPECTRLVFLFVKLQFRLSVWLAVFPKNYVNWSYCPAVFPNPEEVNTKFSVEQVSNKVILPANRKRKASDVGNVREDIKKRLLPLFQDSKDFLEHGIRLVEPLVELCHAQQAKQQQDGLFRDESRLWLAAIRRRLSSKRSAQNPFYTEITRDIPYDIFVVFRLVVRSMPGFCAPFCFVSTNKKGEVVSFTNIRLVAELLAYCSQDIQRRK